VQINAKVISDRFDRGILAASDRSITGALSSFEGSRMESSRRSGLNISDINLTFPFKTSRCCFLETTKADDLNVDGDIYAAMQ
jgi:hypothetical protein